MSTLIFPFHGTNIQIPIIHAEITLQDIINNWSDTDKILYGTPEVKLKSLEAAKNKTIAKQ